MDSSQAGRGPHRMAALDSTMAWMDSLGVEVDPGRQGGYRKIADRWDDAVQGRGKLGVRDLAPMIATCSLEVGTLVAVQRAFQGAAQDSLAGLAARLGQALRGPIRIEGVHGAGPDPARDALFEVLSAASLVQVATQGRVVLETGDGISIANGRHQLGITCARLAAREAITETMTKAGARLAPALSARQGARQRGLLALDASALIRPASALPQRGSRADMERAADQALTAFVDAQMPTIQAGLQPLDRRIVGVMLLFSTVALSEDTQDFYQVGRWALVWRDGLSFGDADLLGRIRDGLRGEA